MAASVLNSPRAVEMSIYVVRAFLRLREALATHKELAAKLAELEQRLETHDHKIVEIVKAIHVLAMPPEKPARQIGFRPEKTTFRSESLTVHECMSGRPRDRNPATRIFSTT